MAVMDHHALLVYGQTIASSAVPETYHTQSIDVTHVVVDKLGIDEARTLTSQAGQTGVAAGRTFVIVTKQMTTQAQNALLKLFEEPPPKTRFYLVIPPGTGLIATLRSRLQVVAPATSDPVSEVYSAFKASAIKDRLALIQTKTKQKDVVWIESVLTGALVEAGTHAAKQSALLCNSYAGGPGASAKLLLEEIALSVPVS